jgi:hypothetical protein
MNPIFSAITYKAVRDRILAQEPSIDETTLADTVEGLTDLHEVLAAVIRAALSDEALAAGLKLRIEEMQIRLRRLQESADKRRLVAKAVMTDLRLDKLKAPDFTASLRAGSPSLIVVNEAAVPKEYWQAREPRLNREKLTIELKQGATIPGVALSNAEPVLGVRTK